MGHLAAADGLLLEFTAEDLFAHLPHDSLDYREFSRLSAELYQRQVGHEFDAGSVTLLTLIEDAIVPFLRSNALEDEMNAVKLALLIKKHVTNIGRNTERKNLVENKFRVVAGKPVKVKGNGKDNELASAQSDYFDDRHHRAGTMILFFVFLLMNEIEAKFGCHVGRQVLALSWSDLQRHGNKLLDIFDTSSVEVFGKVCAESDFKALKGNLANEKKTNVVIFNRHQMDCLQAILQFDSARA